MKSSRYWKLVALLREIQIQGKATYTINQLRQMYNDAVKELDKEISKVFRTFQYGEDITEAEAEELINAESQRRISRELQAELERTDDPSIKAELTRRIHATAYGARISRLEAVKQNVFIYFTKLAIDEIAKTKTLYNTVVEESYYRTIHDFGYGVNMGVNFSLLPSKAIDEIVSAKWHGASFSSRVWSNTKQTAEQAQEIITRGLLSRKSYNQMANELAEVTQNSKYNATRLVRTQCNHYLNAGEFKAYEELGIEQYLYLATLDYKTCRRCQPLDGRIFNTKDRREGVNAPTIHPHCRCTTTVPVEFARRWARDPITGKGVKIPNMTYSEWVESMSEEQKAAFDKNVKMYKNRSSDKKQYERYKERLGEENVPKTFDMWQEMKYTEPKTYDGYKTIYKNAIGYISGGLNLDTGKPRQIITVEHISLSGIPNSITQFTSRKGGIERNYYGADTLQFKQIANNDHGNPKAHPYGKNGEHAHDYIWKNDQLQRPKRELNDTERRENNDIL